jgi:hypothetical protein
VRRAWLVRKLVEHWPEIPMYVLVLEFGWLRSPSQQALQAVVDALPDGPTVLVLNKARNRAVSRRIRQCKDALILSA